MSERIVAEEYAFVLVDDGPTQQRRAVRIIVTETGRLILADWSDENDVFDSGSEIHFAPPEAEALRRALAVSATRGDVGLIEAGE